MTTADVPAKRKRGRPKVPLSVRIVPQVVERVCDAVANGGTISAACREDGMPCRNAIYEWAEADPDGFGRRLARAKELGEDAMIDQCEAIAAAATKDNWQVARLQIETKLKVLAVRNPARFGDRSQVSRSGGSVTIVLHTGVPDPGKAGGPRITVTETAPAALTSPPADDDSTEVE